jgi:multidrug transporter EmrE-like cation transporter
MAIEVPPPELAPAAAPSRVSSLISLAIVLVSVGLATAGHLTLKAAMNDVGRIGAVQVTAVGQTVTKAVREPKLWGGLFLFGFSALLWLVALSRVELSIAYPFAGLSYVAIVLISRYALHESVPPMRWLGVGLIALGIAIVGLSTRTGGFGN